MPDAPRGDAPLPTPDEQWAEYHRRRVAWRGALHRPSAAPVRGPAAPPLTRETMADHTKVQRGPDLHFDRPEYLRVEWPCKKCRHPWTRREADDSVYEDYRYHCPCCGYNWWEEGADA